MMKGNIVFLVIAPLLLLSCTSPQKQEPAPANTIRLTKLECLRQEPPIHIIEHCDLSGDSLTEFPDLSMYAIRSLDLSHNLLSELKKECLPLGLEKLDLSHNSFSGDVHIGVKSDGKYFTIPHIAIPTLIDLDFSHNSLWHLIVYGASLRRLDVSYNDSLSYFDVDNQLHLLQQVVHNFHICQIF